MSHDGGRIDSVGARKVAVISGCGKSDGIGAAIARRFAQAGIAVVVSDVVNGGVQNDNEGFSDSQPSEWQGLPSLCAELGDGSLAVQADLSNREGVETLVSAAMERFGRIDILVNNAAAPKGAYVNDIAAVPVEAWDQVMAINAKGPFLMCRAVVPIMRDQGGGRIINISSVAARIGVPRQAAYAASKSAVVGMTKSVALDVARDGITVNAVLPGRIRTSRTIANAREHGREPGEFVASMAAALPRGRLTDPSEVAEAVWFLASEASSAITGSLLVVDGGEFTVL